MTDMRKLKSRLLKKHLHKKIGLYDRFPTFSKSHQFKPFADEIIINLVKNEPKVLRWCEDNIPWFHLDDEALFALQEEEDYRESQRDNSGEECYRKHR